MHAKHQISLLLPTKTDNAFLSKVNLMIKTTNIQKFYGDLQVLKGVDLHIEKGEIISIVGASGAGKTTLLQILGTLDVQSNPTDSELLINGTEVTKLSDKNLLERKDSELLEDQEAFEFNTKANTKSLKDFLKKEE